MTPQDPFDNLVSRHLQEDGPEGWDAPSAGSWDAISARIQPARRRRWLAWWMLFGLVALGIASFLFLQHSDSQEQPTPADPVAEDVKPFENQQSKEPNTTTNSDLNTSSQTGAESEISNTGNNENSERQPSRNNPISTSSGDLRSVSTTSITAESGAIQKTAALEMRGTDDASIINKSGRDLHAKPVVQSTEDALGTESITNEQTSRERRSVAGNMSMLVSVSPALRTELHLVTVGEIAPMIQRPSTPKWMLSASLTPTLGTRRISVPESQPRVRRNLLLRQEEAVLQLGGGLSLMRSIGSNLLLGIGIDYTRFRINTMAEHQIRYTRVGEMLNDRGNFENRLRLRFNTSYGQINTDVVVERSSDVMLEENRFITLELQTQQSMEVLRFPLTIGYKVPLEKASVIFSGGITGNVLLENRFSFRAVRAVDNDILGAKTLRAVDIEGSKDFALGYQAGVSLVLPIDRRLSLIVSPAVSGYLQPVYEDRHVIIYPFTVEADFGIAYKF